MQHELNGNVAVVTGGGRGIGAAIAATLATMGAPVVIAGRSHTQLESSAAAIRASGGQCEAMACDVSNLGSVETFATP